MQPQHRQYCCHGNVVAAQSSFPNLQFLKTQMGEGNKSNGVCVSTAPPPSLTLYLQGGIAPDVVVEAELPGLRGSTVHGCQVNSRLPFWQTDDKQVGGRRQIYGGL